MNNYREQIAQYLFTQNYIEVNILLNTIIKDDSIPSEEYVKIAAKCKREGFKFGVHFELLN